MKAAIIGLPQTGKKTLFSLISSALGVAGGSGKSSARMSMVKVPDSRLDFLAGLYKPKKLTPASVEVQCLDSIYGEAAHKREVLTQLGNSDIVVHVVRAFEDEGVYHVNDTVDPDRDIANIFSELILCDLYRCEKRIEKLALEIRKKKDEEKEKELVLQQRFRDALEEERPLRDLGPLSEEEERLIRGFLYFTLKNVLIVLNIGDDTAEDAEAVKKLQAKWANDKVGVIAARMRIESEIAELEGEEQSVFMQDMGLKETSLDKIIRETYRLLGLISFFTVGEDEVRAWPVTAGTNAQKGAGEIHSDIERGFIRAEIAHYADLEAEGSTNKLKELGKYYLKGRDYILEDGDIACFRFSV